MTSSDLILAVLTIVMTMAAVGAWLAASAARAEARRSADAAARSAQAADRAAGTATRAADAAERTAEAERRTAHAATAPVVAVTTDGSLDGQGIRFRLRANRNLDEVTVRLLEESPGTERAETVPHELTVEAWVHFERRRSADHRALTISHVVAGKAYEFTGVIDSRLPRASASFNVVAKLGDETWESGAVVESVPLAGS